MGGGPSKTETHEQGQAPKVNHPRFQNIKFTRNKDEQDCIQVKLPVANEREYNQWAQTLKDSPTQSQNFLLPQHHQFHKQGFCGSSGFVTILFDNFPYVLADEIRNRACLQQKFFDEPELWYLIYTLISAGHEFHKIGKKVGDVRPQNVFINEDGQVKVATQLTWPSENTNYHKTFYEKQPTYLAPEQLKDIQFAKMEPSCNPQLAQSFSVGLTCLDAGTLSSSTLLYLKNHKFNYNELGNKLQSLQSAGYSQILCLVVSNLCEPDSDRRSSCSELYKWLQPYQQYIINLQKFEPTSLPQKIAQAGHAEQFVNPPKPEFQAVSPGQTSNYRNTQATTYINNSNSPIQPQSIGQTVTYYQPPPTLPNQPQNYTNPPPQYQIRPQSIQQSGGYQSSSQSAQSYPSYVTSSQQVQQVQQPPPVVSDNKTTTSTYSYQYTSSQYNPSNPQYSQTVQYSVPNAYTTQSVQYPTTKVVTGTAQPDGGADRTKTNMQLTLEKIDEQLQMSRKMFPS